MKTEHQSNAKNATMDVLNAMVLPLQTVLSAEPTTQFLTTNTWGLIHVERLVLWGNLLMRVKVMLVENAVPGVWAVKGLQRIVLLPMGAMRVLISTLPQIHV